MSAPVNLRLTTAGDGARLICEWCGRASRRAYPLRDDGSVSSWLMPSAWSCAPYPADFVHGDGSTGTKWLCGTCERRGPDVVRAPKLDRQ